MFDVTTFANTLQVTGLDVNVNTTGSFTLNVYTKPGTYVGFEQNPSAWTLVSQTNATGQGANNPSFVDVTDFLLPADSLTAIYVQSLDIGNDNFLYTFGANTYSNADLRLDLGTGNEDNFGTVRTPRTWNGTIYYTSVPEPTSVLGLVTAGLLGAISTRKRQPKD
jgi:hypothetical protein